MPVNHQSVTLEYILLGLLRDSPDHGYALFERVQETPELSLIWRVKRSKLYYLLDKLAGEELLSLSIRSQESSPDRKIYQLTAKGQSAFEAWLEEPVLAFRDVRIEFLSKLYFALLAGRETALELIDKQHEVCRGWLESLKAERDQEAEIVFISQQVYQFRIGQISAMITWLEDCRDQIPT
ncbi:MAG: PadR family transcriptional regulator [Anaerolineales bacterium]